MRRTFIVLEAMLLVQLLAGAGLAQQDRLQGRWEGTTKSFQGERPATVVFKKEVDGYTGTVTGSQGEVPFKEIKVEGDNITASAEVDSPQAGKVTINYKFALQGETLNGDGAVGVAGQTFNFTFELKRVSTSTAPPAGASPERRPARTSVPQPQQKQSLDYFVGQWTFKWMGRESALGPGGLKEGTTTFKLASGGKTLESSTEGKSEEGNYQESAVVAFDEATKMLSFSERRRGLQVTSTGDWTSPLAIRFTVDPIKVKDRTLRLKRTIAVISGFSFTVTDELSEDGGPFVRLGQAIYSKANAVTQKQ
jgi:hypothetical protein